MAKLVGVFNTAHTPFCYMPPENWNAIRATRALRADVPMDDIDGNRAKFNRIQDAFAKLRAKMAEVNPDVIIVFGDDQMECFDFTNFPSFAVYVGETFEGFVSSPAALAHDAFQSVGVTPPPEAAELIKDAGPPTRATLKGHPELGSTLLTGLIKRGFDPAFSMEMPKPDFGLGHAFMRPAETLTDMQTPILPVLTNCYYAPQITAARSYQLGVAIREAIEEHPVDLRVAVVGSGGLWHTPARKDAYLDEGFDRRQLSFMEKGDARAMAEHFDSYSIPSGDQSQAVPPRGNASTGMPVLGGPQGGTRETCNWIAATAVAGKPASFVEYVPVYASPIGCGFAYWDGF
jgi:aromatic ring-opening dioxygenase catalytic subunit (LigB family)